ncbi:MAG TPA: gluconolactonase [Planctomycetaceae bacterium]|nr:gluconolactonase [Planctomycetaceae bacterium]
MSSRRKSTVIGALLLAVALVSLTRFTKAQGTESQRLRAPGGAVEKLAGGFLFTEGPACDGKGNVYFTDIPNQRIHVWTKEGKLTTFREKSGGANGLYFDREGNLLACEGASRRVTSISADNQVTVLTDRYEGKKLNSPNDLWIDSKGGVYFTDPRYGKEDDLQQGGFHVYYLPPDRKKLVRVIDNLVKPNGVIGTADGKRLFVADAGADKTYVYRIQPDGSLTDRKLFARIGSDGMTLDEKGNLYLTRDAVRVYDPDGTEVAVIEVPETPSNVCFGSADRKTLFITARTSLYSIRMTVQGQ